MFLKGGKSEVRNYIYIVFGTALMAVAINSVYDPTKMITGGFSALAIVIKSVTKGVLPGGIPLWLTNAILNIPLFLIGIKLMGTRFLVKSMWGTALLSVWLYFLPVISLFPGDLVLSAIFGGVLMGVGTGLVFLGRGTTGGTDMVAAIIQKKVRHYSIAQILMVIDGAIVLLGAFLFGIHLALYSIVAIFVTTKVADGLLEGLHYAKIAYVISGQYERVAARIMEELERGVTGISARGMYMKTEKQMLFCVVSKKEIVRLKELVAEIDKDAFLIVSDAREVLGEGFIEH